jgi:hypothetical protein
MECCIAGVSREIHLSTEGDEVILSFGFSHLHSSNFFDDKVERAVGQIREHMLAIMNGEMVSYRVFGERGIMRRGFCATDQFDSELKGWGPDQWTRVEVMGWIRSLDRSVHRT